MKIEVISVKDLEPFMKYTQWERELQVRLHKMKETKEREIEELKGIRVLCIHMKHFKDKYGFKTDKEMMKIIKKHAIQ